jgi:hypothetical protein
MLRQPVLFNNSKSCKEKTMQAKTQKETTVTAQSFTNDDPPRCLVTLKRFSEKHSDFITLAGITNQVFKAQSRNSTKGEIPGNGMLDFGVIVRIGRKVLIDEDAYFRWIAAQQKIPE